MHAVDIIIKKRDGQQLSPEEITFFVGGITDGSIPDYQISAWAMAVLLKGMTAQETTDLALAMAHSGQVLDLSHIVKYSVDKHSTGGVGDKTTLVVQPIVAACGLPVAKMSGRGLGFSGGTLDKLESIPGYQVDLTPEEFENQLSEIGIVLSGQSHNLAPADGRLYALRDVTGTVPSIPLIASSVMSKKIAAGAQAVVLDVKVGSGAFMKDLDSARQLAALMVEIGELAGRKVVCLLSDMNQPLGMAVGNTLEMQEAIYTLGGAGPLDFREHCLVVSAHMLTLGGLSANLGEARKLAETALTNGSALKEFRTLVDAQGGDASYVDHPEKFPRAPLIETVTSTQSGYLSKVDARVIGETSVNLGAGRIKRGDRIDHTVGLQVPVKVGDRIEAGQPLLTIHARDEQTLNAAKEQLQAAFDFSETEIERLPLFYPLTP